MEEEVNLVDGKALDGIIKKTVGEIEKSKTQIFDIYEGVFSEVEETKLSIEDIKAKLDGIIPKVDDLERMDVMARNRLMKVSSNFDLYSEDVIRKCYENAESVQLNLILLRQEELSLRQQRDRLEVRLRNLLQTVDKAEKLMTQISVVLDYFSNHIQRALAQMGAANQEAGQDKLVAFNIIKAQEVERLRVSREIHDGPAQVMAHVIYRSTVCERLIDVDVNSSKRELQDLRQQIRGCLSELRKIIFDLRPMSLDDLGLVAAIHYYLKQYKSRYNINVRFSVVNDEYDIDPDIKISAFRIIQEGLQNIYKHAQVDSAELILSYRQSSIVIEINDSGCGFEVDDNGRDDCFGLIGIRERVKILKGGFNIKSDIGKGTKLSIRIPASKSELQELGSSAND